MCLLSRNVHNYASEYSAIHRKHAHSSMLISRYNVRASILFNFCPFKNFVICL